MFARNVRIFLAVIGIIQTQQNVMTGAMRGTQLMDWSERVKSRLWSPHLIVKK